MNNLKNSWWDGAVFSSDFDVRIHKVSHILMVSSQTQEQYIDLKRNLY